MCVCVYVYINLKTYIFKKGKAREGKCVRHWQCFLYFNFCFMFSIEV